MKSWKQHLREASTTLAMSAQSLDKPLQHHVTMGVLVLHALHEFEACAPRSPRFRRKALLTFSSLCESPSARFAEHMVRSLGPAAPSLLADLPRLVDDVNGLPTSQAKTTWHHASRAAERALAYCMRARADGQVTVRDAEELAGFCVTRTGIATELFTDLMLALHPELDEVADALRERACAHGQVVGLVDYLDGSGSRHTCPAHLTAPGWRIDVLTLSSSRMLLAEQYVDTLRETGAPRDVIAFASLPIAWAKSRLDRMQCCEADRASTPSWLPPLPSLRREALGTT